jgi:hypothetical protein
MIISAQLTGRSVVPCSPSKDSLMRDAVRFCGRGIGLSDAALSRYEPSARKRAERLDDVVLLRVW